MCYINDCSNAGRHRVGLCLSHYKRLLKYGDPLAGERFRRPKGLSEEEAFRWFMPGDPPLEGCWDWTASTVWGYGQFTMTTNGKLHTVRAHRAAYRIFRGPIPEGPDVDVLHYCDRKICVQPAHLHLGDADLNMQEALERGFILVGEQCSWSKLTEADVLLIRSSDLSGTEMARQFNVSQPIISDIRRGKKWKHLL